MVGTAIAALQVKCGQPPLALRWLGMISDYAVKIKSVPDHPTASTLDNCWQNHYTVYADGRVEPFGVKASKVRHRSTTFLQLSRPRHLGYRRYRSLTGNIFSSSI